MNVLVIGGGGREHAILWKLAQSRGIDRLYSIPGNGGIAEIAECHEININDFETLLSFTRQKGVDLVIVGPEDPLASGIVDAFDSKGVPVFGPKKDGAMIEASKVFSKGLMSKSGIPTAGFKVFSRYEEAKEYVEAISPPFIIKADGLCAGKGAYVIKEKEEAQRVIRSLMVELIHGEAGRCIVIEDFIKGIEASYLVFTDGQAILPMLPSQDHKPLLDGDKGPNTGGMGAYTPVPFMTDALIEEIDDKIMKRTIDTLRIEGITYKGVLYAGLMIDDTNPYVLEFNARFGDPETQPILFKMKSDLLPILISCIEGRLDKIKEIEWKDGVSICVCIASRGYPERPEKGMLINGLEALKGRGDVMVFHAGTKKVGDKFYTSGGRVIGVTAIGDTYKDAIEKVYEAVSCIKFEGMHYRRDIGHKALKYSN